ncbi:MAG: IS110 family transposase [Kiritimatiellae bacterium]|nr:IS110 family transposase [Kiritimatiellia bacterium]
MQTAKKIVGIDVGKDWLDVCYPDGRKEHIRNIRSCRTKLIKKAAKLGAIVCFEATGPYEEPLADECLARGVKAVRLDAWGTRKFAESQGRIEKTDAIDCEMIRDYAASLKDEKLHFIKPRSEAQKRLKKSVRTRKNLLKARAIIANQFEDDLDPETARHLRSALKSLDKNIAKVEAECDAAIASDARLSELDRRFREVKGVGPCLSRTVLAQCPDIGDFNSKSIAKMCGNAPLDHESCTIKYTAKPRRGRSDLKKALYMAAVSASRNNHILREFYQRLVANGKPRKVALTAVARRIAILLNTIAKHPDFKPAQAPKATAKKAGAKRGRPRKAK